MTYNIQNLIEHFQIFSKSSKKLTLETLEKWWHTINYVSLCSANQLHLWTMHASYHIIDFDSAKAEKNSRPIIFFTSLQLCEIALFISLKHSVSLSGSQLPVSHLISQHLANHSVIQLSRKSACQWKTLIMSIGLFWASKSASQLVSQTVNYQPANQLFHCSVSLWNNEKTFG